MVITIPSAVIERLEAVEAEHGVPVKEQLHEAIAFWSHLTPTERREIGFVAMQLVARRPR